MTTEENSSLIQWYVEREKQLNSKEPTREAQLIKVLENNPKFLLANLKAMISRDIPQALAFGNLKGPDFEIIDTLDSTVHAEAVLDALKKEFLK